MSFLNSEPQENQSLSVVELHAKNNELNQENQMLREKLENKTKAVITEAPNGFDAETAYNKLSAGMEEIGKQFNLFCDSIDSKLKLKAEESEEKKEEKKEEMKAEEEEEKKEEEKMKAEVSDYEAKLSAKDAEITELKTKLEGVEKLYAGVSPEDMPDTSPAALEKTVKLNAAYEKLETLKGKEASAFYRKEIEPYENETNF